MPAIRSIQINSTSLQFTDYRGVAKQLLVSQIPSTQNTVAKVETWLNGTWIPANADLTSYQMVAHVFSISPFSATIYVANIGATIPSNWWT
jgi:hypothetical protein